jgi:transglutaminase-like putative cysteine protease
MTPFFYYYAQMAGLLFFLKEEIHFFTIFLFLLVPLQKRWAKIPFFDKIFGALSFVFSYVLAGHQVNPEMGLNLLVGVLSLKLLESRELRDYRMQTLGLFILWGAGALFDKSIGYFLLAFLATIYNVFFLLNLSTPSGASGKSFALWILKALPFALMFFLFQPRFHSTLWSPPQQQNSGEIGFSEVARPSEVGEIFPSDKISFHAHVVPDVPREVLYWRGVTLSGSDGWNWEKSELDQHYPSLDPLASVISPDWIKQEIIHKTTPERAFGLDRPMWWVLGDREARASELGSLSFHHFRSYKRYKVVSSTASLAPLEQHLARLSRSTLKEVPGLPSKVDSLEQAQSELQSFYQKNQFLYTLSPGKIKSLNEFLQTRRGWCTHFASASAEILRFWGFPTRLVSGYLGGEKIEGESYYTVTENDAHVWIEVYSRDKWVRIDPTLWVEPMRLQFTGRDLFVREKKKFDLRAFYPEWLRGASSWIDKTNFRFMLWLEDYDREKQKEIAQKLDLNLSEFYMLVVWVLLVFIAIFFFIEWRRNQLSPAQRRQKIWKKFLARHGVPFRPDLTPSEARLLLPAQALEAHRKLTQFEHELYALDNTTQKNMQAPTIKLS